VLGTSSKNNMYIIYLGNQNREPELYIAHDYYIKSTFLRELGVYYFERQFFDCVRHVRPAVDIAIDCMQKRDSFSVGWSQKLSGGKHFSFWKIFEII